MADPLKTSDAASQPDPSCRCAWKLIVAMMLVAWLFAAVVQYLSQHPTAVPSELLAKLIFKVVPAHDPKMIDPDAWGLMGLQVAEGRGLLEANEPSAFRGPVAPLVFAAIARAFGGSLETLLAAQTVLFAFGCGAVGGVAQKVLHDRRITCLTMLIYIGFIPAYPWFCHIFTEPLFTLLLAMFVLVWLATLERTAPWSLASGALLAVTALCRPVMYFFLPIMLLYELRRKGFTRQAVGSIAAILVGFLLLEVPWIVRNQMVLGRFVPTTTGGAQALYLATWHQQANWMNNVFHDPQRFPLAGEGFWDLPKEERETRFRAMARENFHNDPGKVIALVPKRMLMFLFQMRDTGWLPTTKSMALSGAIYSLAIVGYCLLPSESRRRYGPLLWLIVFQVAFHSLLQAEYRYSHPIQPYIFLLTAAGLVGLWDRFVAPSSSEG